MNSERTELERAWPDEDRRRDNALERVGDAINTVHLRAALRRTELSRRLS